MNKKIIELEEKLLKFKKSYYQGNPEISDFEFDKLEEELRELDPANAILNSVGFQLFSDNKIEHSTKMLSLSKTYNADDIEKWRNSEEIVSTFKIDGSSCSLEFEKGKLKLAKTRGDGKFGENISQKILYIKDIPKTIETNEKIEVRGEVYCTEESFINLSNEMISRGLEKPSNLRNIVAGILGRKENIDLARFLSFQAFELLTDLNEKTEELKLKKLKKYGFQIPEYIIHKDKKSIGERIEETKEFLSEGNYLIDGIVFTFNQISLHEELGETAHHPRYKIAFKFAGDTKVTKINSISWQVSRNGILTPVGNIEPVELSGAMVARVTLHNYGMVKQNNLKIGDEIEIVRSGEVIPKFLSVVRDGGGEFKIPEKCPSCGKETFVEEIRLYCKNDKCPDKVKDEILNFIQKIGIDDLSSKRLEELIRLELISDIPSLYQLKKESLLTVDKVKEKLADKLIENIEKSKKANLITFLSALGISGGAYNKCEKIVLNGFNTIESILALTSEDLVQIDSFAEKSATDFVNSLESKKEIVRKLITYGFELKSNLEINTDSKISGKKFCITGTLSMKRSDLQKMIKDNGGIVQSGVNKDTDFLLTNDTASSSSKFKKATELKISIINEEKFLNLIK